MLDSKYSEYSYEQIVEDTPAYKPISDKLLEIYGNASNTEKMRSIIYEGGLEDFTINCGRTRNDTYIERNKRLAYAYLLANNPETFDKIKKDNVILFHGTRVAALPSILKYGMNSFDKSNADGIEVTTGEKSTRGSKGRDFISFTDDIGVAAGYSSLANLNGQENDFGVIIGISIDSVKKLRTCTVYSELPEVGIRDNMPVEHIKMLMVPPGKVNFVKRIVGDLPIEVMPMNIDEPFYKIDKNYLFEQIAYNSSSYQTAIDVLFGPQEKTSRTESEYAKQDMKDLAEGRKLSRILGWINRLKEKIVDRGTEDNVR